MDERVQIDQLLEQVRGRRRVLLIGGVGTGILGLGTLLGPFVGSMVVAVTLVGSPLTRGPIVELGLSDSELSMLVGLGSLLVSGPLCLVMLYGSWIWHRLAREEAEEVGIAEPALGIRAPARLVALPLLLGGVLTGLLLPLSWMMPAPDSGDILGNALAGAATLTPLLGPLIGLLVGWRRGVDARLTERSRAGELSLRDLDDEPAAFPLIARRPRSLVRAELLLEAGRVDEADALIRRYLEQVGVGLYRSLILWSRVYKAAGRIHEAERVLASAARLVPLDGRALAALAELRRGQGLPDDAAQIEAELEAMRGGLISGLAARRLRVPA